MPRDASATRDRLLRAGERLFAVDGIHRARTRDIVQQAGQSNDSAVTYHFGSREGLLTEIVLRHIREMEGPRAARLDDLERRGAHHDLTSVVRALLDPTGDRLTTPAGRHFLRIAAQLARFAPVAGLPPPEELEGTHLLRQIQLFEQCLADELPPALVAERITMAIGFITTALADRATAVETDRVCLDHATWMENLHAMVVGAVQAPAGTTAARGAAG